MRKQVDNQKQKPTHGTKKSQTENNNQEQWKPHTKKTSTKNSKNHTHTHKKKKKPWKQTHKITTTDMVCLKNCLVVYLKSLEENAECWYYHMQYHWAHIVHKQTDFIPHYRYQCYLHGDDFQDNCQFVEHSKHLWDCLHLHHCHPEMTLFDGM